MKKSVFLILCLVFLFSAVGFFGCGEQEEQHTHAFTLQNVEQKC